MKFAVTLTVTCAHGNVAGRMTDPASWEATVAARDEALAKLKAGELGFLQLVNVGDNVVHVVPPAVANASVLTFGWEEIPD